MNSIMTTKQVLAIVPFSRTKLLQLINENKFPAPNKSFGKRKWLFNGKDIKQWIKINIGEEI